MDIKLTASPDGGDFEFVNGQLTLDDGPETAIYLSLFGGNFDDSGDEVDDTKQWWGNLTTDVDEEKYRSRTQHTLRGLPATTGNLVAVRNAATADLEWMRRTVFDDISVTASIPQRGWVRISIQTTINGETTPYFFDREWTR